MTPEQNAEAAGVNIVSFVGNSASAVPVQQKLPLIWFDDTRPKLDRPYLIKGLLSGGAFTVIYGKPGSGKTFFGQDIGLHIALGLPWRGRRVNQVGVIYIAAEGGDGALNRVAAFKNAHPEVCNGPVPFATIAAPVNLLDPDADSSIIVERIREAERVIGRPIGLFVIDTLSRALAGGDENGPEGMGLFVRNVDRIRAETKAHAVVIHHSGKDDTKGSRGHSSLLGALDTEIEISHDKATGVRTVTVTKQRDLPGEGDQFAFRLLSVDLGADSDGDQVTSCIVEPVENDPTDSARNGKSKKVPAGAIRALELLRTVVADHGTQPPRSNHIPANARVVAEKLWRLACYAGQITESDKPDAQQKAFARAAAALINAGHVRKWNEFIWLP